MTLSITIPQLFYDLIARVIPGFLFLLMLGFEVSAIAVNANPQEASSDNPIATIMVGLALIILCYLMGWVLRAFTFLSVEKKVKAEYELKEKPPSVEEKYNRIRMENEAIGFRITKLRAEARMLETLRTGMTFVFLIGVSLLLLNQLAFLPITDQSVLVWAIRLGIPLVLAIAFWRCERRGWRNFYGNVNSHYGLVLEKAEEKQRRPPTKQKAT